MSLLDKYSIFVNKITPIMRTLEVYILLMIMSLASSKLHAKDMISYTLNIEHGLPCNYIREIEQDSAGYLWMASTNGLVRYDGHFFVNYTAASPGSKGLLTDNSLLALKMWRGHYLWIKLRGDLYSMFDINSGKFIDYTGNGTNNQAFKRMLLTHEHIVIYGKKGCRLVEVGKKGAPCALDLPLPKGVAVNVVRQSPGGNLWLVTDRGVFVYSKGHLHALLMPKHLNGKVCDVAFVDKNVYAVTTTGVILTSRDAKTATVVYDNSVMRTALGATDRLVQAAAFGHRIILLGKGHTYEYLPRTRTFRQADDVECPNGNVISDDKGNRAIVNDRGMFLFYHQPTGRFVRLNVMPLQMMKFINSARFCMVAGEKGSVWVSAFGNGLFHYYPHTGELQHVTAESPNPLITSNYIVSLFRDRTGNLFVSQEDMGLACITPRYNLAEYVYFDDNGAQSHTNRVRMLKRLADGSIIASNMDDRLMMATSDLRFRLVDNPTGDNVICMARDKQGQTWLGTRNNGVFVNGKQYAHDDNNPYSPIDNHVHDMLCDSKGRVWLLYQNYGLAVAVPDGKGGYLFRHLYPDNKLRSNLVFRRIVQDYRGYILVGTSKGLIRFLPERLLRSPKQFEFVNFNKQNRDLDEVKSIYEDRHHRLWVGVRGYGLVMMDNTGKKPVVRRLYRAQRELSDDDIESIVEDKWGNIWIGTDRGINFLNHKTGQFRYFMPADRGMGNMCVENCLLSLPDGTVAFGTNNGIALVNLHKLTLSRPTLPLAITDVMVNGVSLREHADEHLEEGPVEKMRKLHLPYDENSLQFRFSDFDYQNTRNTRFTYILEGYESSWNPPSTEAQATYRNLSPGIYKLRVKACDAYGQWNPHEAVLEVVIRSPWWATWWAICVYVLALGTIALLVYCHFMRINEMRNKIKVEQQLTDYKLHFFTNISHEFRTPLTIIRGAMDNMMRQKELPSGLKQPMSSMSKSVERMMRLVNQLLEFRKMQQGKLSLRLEQTEVIGFVQSIFFTFKEMAENKEMTYTFVPFAKHYDMYVDRGMLDKIVYNLLSNAFKYTQSRHRIEVRIVLNDEEQLVISVIDNGIGISKEKQTKLFTPFMQSGFSRESIGIGLHLVQELVRVHHGKIWFEENPGGGSIFRVALPVQKSAYQPDDFMSETDKKLLRQEDAERNAGWIPDYKAVAAEPINYRTLLVVDDDDDVREFVKSELSHYFCIHTACNGAEALDRMREQRPDLLLSDVMMPVMDGYELTRRVRMDASISDIPVILLTALDSEEKKLKGIGTGADAYLSKPFSTQMLVAVCRRLIEQHDKTMAAARKNQQAPVAAPVITNEIDRRFREQMNAWLHAHISDSNLNVDELARKLGYGRSTFYKRVKAITGQSPNDYVKKIRMELALELLKDDRLTIAEIAYKIGIEDPYYFSRIFKGIYGVSPTKYRTGKK